MPRIVLKKKAEVIAEYRFGRKKIITIGSMKGNDIVIADKNVSERHCSITLKDSVYEIRDNNTVSGTRVNDRSINVKDLQFGDTIGVGSYSLVLYPDRKKKDNDPETAYPQSRYLLLGIYGKFEGKEYELKEGESYIGRELISPRGITNDIVLTGDMTVSKGHAKIACYDNQCILTDIGSTGGVAVNGSKVGQLNNINLHLDDEIAIGRSIFRLVDDQNENFAVPKKHSILLLKIRQPLIRLSSLVLIAVSLATLYKGFAGLSIINSAVRKVNIEMNRFWSAEDNMVRTSLPDYDISSSPAIGDINNDGNNDIVFLNSSGLLYAWDGKKGTQMWKPVEIFNSGKSSPALGDMNGDGMLDITVLSDNAMLYIVDGKTGGIIRKEILGGSIAELSPVVGDLNGDGEVDIVACSEEGMVHFVYSPGLENRMEKYAEYVDAPVYASPVIVTTKKISPMVVVGSYNSKIALFDGKSRSKRTIDLAEKTGKVHLIASAPAVGDLNGDGIPEIVVQSNVPQYVSAIDINRFEVNWTYFVEPIPPAGLRHIASPVVADVNRDGLSDVMVLSANGFVYALKGKTGFPAGELLWKMQITESNKIISAPSLCDLEKDGIADIVFGTEDGLISVAKNSPHRREMEVLVSIKASNSPITSSIAIGDVNGDGYLDLVYSGLNDVVQVLNTNVRTFKNKIVWPMYLGSSLHSVDTFHKDDDKPYKIMLASGLGMLLTIGILSFLIRSKHLRKRPKVVYL